LNTRLKTGISLVLTGGVLIFVASIWMILYPPNFLASQMIAVPYGLDFLVYSLWLYYSSFAPIFTEWLWVGYFGLIVSIIVFVLTLAIAASKLLNHIFTISMLVNVLGIVEFLTILLVDYFLYNNNRTDFPQLTLIFILLGVVGAVLTYFGGGLFRFGYRSEKFAKEAKWRKMNKWDEY
jgi:hypothetical protein